MPGFDHVVTLRCELVVRETGSAILCRVPSFPGKPDEEHWIPKSHVAPHSPVRQFGDTGQLIVTAWIAREKGLL